MNFQIAGQPVPTNNIYFREFGYNSAAPGYPVFSYSMTVSVSDFCEAFQNYYEDYAEDDRQYGLDADELDLELRQRGWPSLENLASNYPGLLERFLLAGASYDALQALFARETLSETQDYIINNVTSVTVNGASMSFQGEALYCPEQ